MRAAPDKNHEVSTCKEPIPMKRLLGIFLLIFPLGVFAAPPYTHIDNAQMKALQAQGVPLYDIRRPDEWLHTGVVDGSRLLTFVDTKGRPMPDFLSRFTAEVGKNDQVILICRVGNRSEALAKLLVEKLGYTQIYNVRQGITQWVVETNPVVRN